MLGYICRVGARPHPTNNILKIIKEGGSFNIWGGGQKFPTNNNVELNN